MATKKIFRATDSYGNTYTRRTLRPNAYRYVTIALVIGEEKNILQTRQEWRVKRSDAEACARRWDTTRYRTEILEAVLMNPEQKGA